MSSLKTKDKLFYNDKAGPFIYKMWLILHSYDWLHLKDYASFGWGIFDCVDRVTCKNHLLVVKNWYKQKKKMFVFFGGWWK